MATDAVATTVAVTDTPEFKEALSAATKAAREELEKTIRASNQQQLEAETRKLEALYQVKPKEEPAPTGKDFFTAWGEKHGLPPEAGVELAEGIVQYVRKTDIAPLAGSQRRSELRMQRQDVRASDPALAKLDDQYGAEVMKLLETVQTLHADSYAAALELVIGRHIKDVLAQDRKGRAEDHGAPPEVKPGPTPQTSQPKPKGKVELDAHQQQRAVEMGLSEADYVETVTSRAKGMKARGFTEPAIRQQLGRDLGTLTF